MGLLDVFRPRWKHSNPAVRLEALKTLDDDEALAQAASQDSDERVRRLAIKQMMDPWRLKNVAGVQTDDRLKSFALGRARELFVQIALAADESEKSALSAVRDLDSQEHLVDIAMKAKRPAVRTQAFDLVVSKAALMGLVRRATDFELRKMALARITDSTSLKQLAVQERDPQFAVHILQQLPQEQDLIEVAQRAQNKSVAKLARARTKRAGPTAAPSPEVVKQVEDLEGKRRHARQFQLAREAEALAERGRHGAAQDQQQALQLETEWSMVSVDAEAVVRDRFERALARFAKLHGAASQSRRAADEKQAASRVAAKVKELTDRMVEPAPRSAAPPAEDQPQDQAGDTGQDADGDASPNGRRPQVSPEFVKAEREALQVLKLQLEEALGSDSLRTLDGAVRQTRSVERRLSRLPEADRADLQPGFIELRSNLIKRLSDAEQREAWKRWANVQRFEAICQQAEVLRDILPDFPDKEQAPKELANLRTAWRRGGPVPAAKRNELWSRFKAACDAVMAIVESHRAPAAQGEPSMTAEGTQTSTAGAEDALEDAPTTVAKRRSAFGPQDNQRAQADDDDAATVVSQLTRDLSDEDAATVVSSLASTSDPGAEPATGPEASPAEAEDSVTIISQLSSPTTAVLEPGAAAAEDKDDATVVSSLAAAMAAESQERAQSAADALEPNLEAPADADEPDSSSTKPV